MMKRNTSSKFGRWVPCAAFFGLCILYYICCQQTLIVWWWPVAGGALPALATAPVFHRRWRRLTGTALGIVNAGCHTAAVTLLAGLLFLGANSLLASETTYEQEAVVRNRWKQTRRMYTYVGGHLRPRGTHDYWYVYVAFPDGIGRKYSVPLTMYNRIRTDRRLTFTLRRGFFGFPVVVRNPIFTS